MRRFLPALAAAWVLGTPAFAAPQALPETAPEDNRMIHQRGTQIVDGNDQPLKLRGVNLGGWFLWEPYNWGAPLSLSVSESVMQERMRKLVGDAETERFIREYQANYIREPDIARIAAMGFNVVRLPLHRSVLEDDARPLVYKASGWQSIDTLLDWAEKHRVYVVLDLHAAPGGQNRIYISDPDPRGNLWESRLNQDRTVALWRAIAQRYRDRSIVAGYDLLNEPSLWLKGQDLVPLYRRVIAAIREVDPHHMLILEGARLASDFSMFDRPLSRNQAYSFHMYTWFGDNRKRLLKRYAELAQRQGVPLWCGEWGENNAGMVRSTLEMFEDEQYLVQGWAFWPWKKVPKKTSWLVGIVVTDRWKEVVKSIAAGRPPRKAPPRDELLREMDGFLRALLFENNIENAEIREILTPPLRLTP